MLLKGRSSQLQALAVLPQWSRADVLVYRSEEQATGIERFELLGDLMGVDVFDLKPIDMTRMGTMADPIPIFSLVDLASYSCL